MVNIGSSERPDLPIALVIGAGAMGMSTARRLGQSCRVVVADLAADKNPEREAALRADGLDAVAVGCDITDPASVAELARFVAARGPLRTLAHVAALSPATLGEKGDWRLLLRVDLVGAALVEQAMRPLAQAGTAAVFISSLAGHRPQPPSPELIAALDEPLAADLLARVEALAPDIDPSLAYALAKYGLIRMVQRRAAAWGRHGARILSLSPGLIATPMGTAEFARNRELKLGLLTRTPLGREGTMVEIADAIEFLASSRASFITGTDLLVDGGAAAAIRFPE